MSTAGDIQTRYDLKDLVDSQLPRPIPPAKLSESRRYVAQEGAALGPALALARLDLGSSDCPDMAGRPRTLWEMLLRRPAYNGTNLNQAPHTKVRIRQHPESKHLGQHAWDTNYYEKDKSHRTPLSAPRWEALPDPRPLYEDLEFTVSKMGCNFGQYWDYGEVLSIRTRERHEVSARNLTRAEAKDLRHLQINCFPSNISGFTSFRSKYGMLIRPLEIFHTRLHKVLLYTATDVVFRGYTHEIPIVVHSCVQDILARGESLVQSALLDDS